MKRAARIDENQNEIVKGLRSFGATVLILSQIKNAFDILVGFRGKLFIMEIKNPKMPLSKRGLTDGEDKCRRDFENVGVPYYVVLDIEQAIKIIDIEEIKLTQDELLNRQLTSIIDDCAEVFGITYADVVSRSQKAECVFARQIAQYIIRNKYYEISLTKIASLFHIKTHGTIINSIKQAEMYLKGRSFTTNRYITFEIDKVKEVINKHLNK